VNKNCWTHRKRRDAVLQTVHRVFGICFTFTDSPEGEFEKNNSYCYIYQKTIDEDGGQMPTIL